MPDYELVRFVAGQKPDPTLLGTGTPNGTKFLRDDGAWITPQGGAAAIANGNTANVVATSVDTYLAGSSLAIGGRVKAGTILRWTLAFTKSAAGTATPIVNVRFGTLATVVDTARLTWTGVAQTAATDTGRAYLTVVLRDVTASGVAAGALTIEHFNTTTGLANKAQPQIFSTVSSAFDLTPAGLIAGLSINPGTAGVWTFQSVAAEAANLA